MLTRTVTCPCCRAQAMLSYAPVDDAERRHYRDHHVYVCPNLCAVPPRQLLALMGTAQQPMGENR